MPSELLDSDLEILLTLPQEEAVERLLEKLMIEAEREFQPPRSVTVREKVDLRITALRTLREASGRLKPAPVVTRTVLTPSVVAPFTKPVATTFGSATSAMPDRPRTNETNAMTSVRPAGGFGRATPIRPTIPIRHG
jgi:hypothetical protein